MNFLILKSLFLVVGQVTMDAFVIRKKKKSTPSNEAASATEHIPQALCSSRSLASEVVFVHSRLVGTLTDLGLSIQFRKILAFAFLVGNT